MRFFTAKSIAAKILIRSIAVALVPMAILASVVFVGLEQLSSDATTRVDESRQVLESESVLATSKEQSESVAREINLILKERIADVVDWARNREVVDGTLLAAEYAEAEGLNELSIEALESRFDGTKSTLRATAARTYLRTELQSNDFFTEIFFTDANGYNAAITNLTSDFVQSDEEWWTRAWDEGINIDDIEFDESAGGFSVDIAVRIDNPANGSGIGVLKTTLDAQFIADIIQDRSTETTKYTVALNDGQIIAETSTLDAEGETDSSRLMNLAIGTANPGIAAALETTDTNAIVTDEMVYGFAHTPDPVFFNAEETGFGGFDWIVVSTQSAETAFAPLAGLEQLQTEIDDSGRQLQIIVAAVVLAALLLAYVMARFMAQSITVPIRKLTEAASVAAATGLPNAVARINADDSDIEAIAVPEVDIRTGDELEELANSFNSVQGTAVTLAARQARSRRNTSEMFVNLGRRNQSLLKRQLRFIDELEQNEEDPDALDSLFKLDHLATRMRRNAESLLVLAGDRTPRRWTAPIPIRDAVQAALGEVEDYERVDFHDIEDGDVQGNVVADIAHILAELVENALNFSPPPAEVSIAGRVVESGGYVITILDEGLGMRSEEMVEANARLSETRELSDVPAQYLGLFVVGRLAQRHNVQVRLGDGPTGGLIARVELPASLTKSETTDDVQTDLDGQTGDEEAAELNIDEAEAQVFALLAQAEEALARIEEAKKRRNAAATEVDRENPIEAATSGPTEPTPAIEPVTETSTARPITRSIPESGPGQRDESEHFDPAPLAGQRETDPAPAESVEVGEFAFRRRGSAPGPAPAVENIEPPTLARRTTDPAPETTSDLDGREALDTQFGFSRRESKANAAETVDMISRPVAPTSAEPVGEGDAMVAAERNRNRWSRFQRGKDDALAPGTPSTSSTEQ
ncbi:MAG: signal transduction histidine kinase [Acidimicrobiales bacterium]|jgi:signal transduction histidine kinase